MRESYSSLGVFACLTSAKLPRGIIVDLYEPLRGLHLVFFRCRQAKAAVFHAADTWKFPPFYNPLEHLRCSQMQQIYISPFYQRKNKVGVVEIGHIRQLYHG